MQCIGLGFEDASMLHLHIYLIFKILKFCVIVFNYYKLIPHLDYKRFTTVITILCLFVYEKYIINIKIHEIYEFSIISHVFELISREIEL